MKAVNTNIIINGRNIHMAFANNTITYSLIWALAFNKKNRKDILSFNPSLLCTYSKGGIDGKEQGIITFGDEVKVYSGMIFNITQTDKA